MHLEKRLRWRFGFHRLTLRQLRTGQPPVVRATFRRLRAGGVSAWRAWRLLSAVYEAEVAAMLLEGRVFDEARYLGLLAALPVRPQPTLADVRPAPRAAI